MVLVHVRDRAFLGGDQFVRAGQIGQHVGGRQIGRAREAAIEMRRDDRHAPEREVAEAGIKLRLRMAREETPAHARVVGAVASRCARTCRARSGADAPADRPCRSRRAGPRRGRPLPGWRCGSRAARSGSPASRRGRSRPSPARRTGGRYCGRACPACRPGSPAAGSWPSAFGSKSAGGRAALGQAVRHRAGQGRAWLRHSALLIRSPNSAKCFIRHDFSQPLPQLRQFPGLVWNRGRARSRAAEFMLEGRPCRQSLWSMTTATS